MNRLLYIIIILLCLCGCKETSKKDVIATIDNSEITLTEIDKIIDKQLHLMLQGIHILRKETLNNYINELILNKEAIKRGMSTEELKTSIIKNKLTEEVITKRALELKGMVPDARDPMKVYDIKTNYGYEYFIYLMQNEVFAQYIDSVKPNYNISSNLPSPDRLRASVNTNELTINYLDYKKKGIPFILIGNYSCSSCQSSLEIINGIFEKHKKELSYGYVFHDAIASLPALAASAAAEQDKFSEMHKKLYANQTNIYDTLEIKGIAIELGLNIEQFNIALIDDKNKKTIGKNIDILNEQGVYATPTLVINGKVFMPPFKETEIEQYIEKLVN